MKGTRYTDEPVARICRAAVTVLRSVQEPGLALSLCPCMSGAPDPDEIEVVQDMRRGLTPRARHAVFLASRPGWRPGPDNPEARTHPDIRDYGELSQDRKDRDRLTLAIVTTLTLTE